MKTLVSDISKPPMQSCIFKREWKYYAASPSIVKGNENVLLDSRSIVISLLFLTKLMSKIMECMLICNCNKSTRENNPLQKNHS